MAAISAMLHDLEEVRFILMMVKRGCKSKQILIIFAAYKKCVKINHIKYETFIQNTVIRFVVWLLLGFAGTGFESHLVQHPLQFVGEY